MLRRKATHSGLKERHGGVHDTLDSGSVKGLGCEVGESRERCTHHEERYGLGDTERGVDTHLRRQSTK